MLSNIKGIGPKTAQRIIVELKDKILKVEVENDAQLPMNDYAPAVDGVREEAVAALMMLGFAAAPSTKAVNQILQQQADATVEQVIKAALKML